MPEAAVVSVNVVPVMALPTVTQSPEVNDVRLCTV